MTTAAQSVKRRRRRTHVRAWQLAMKRFEACTVAAQSASDGVKQIAQSLTALETAVRLQTEVLRAAGKPQPTPWTGAKD